MQVATKARYGFQILADTCKSIFFDSKLPTRIIVHVNDICNSRCPTCYIWKNKNQGHLACNQILSFIDQIFSIAGPRTVVLTGGEPLLRSDIFELVEGIRKRKGKATILTNGLLLSPKMIDKLHAAGLNTLTISLNSADPTVHDASRGRTGNFRLIDEALRYMRKNDIPLKVEFICIIFRDNIIHLPELIAYAESVQAHVNFQPIHRIVQGGKYLSEKAIEEELHKMLPDQDTDAAFISLQKAIAKSTYSSFPASYLQKYKEFLGNSSKGRKKKLRGNLILMHDGNIHLSNQLPPIGNITQMSLDTILCGEKAQKQRSSGEEMEHCLCEMEPTLRDLFEMGYKKIRKTMKKPS